MSAFSTIFSAAVQGSDPAELGQLTATVERILPAIEQFRRYEGRDEAGRRRPGWLARLDVPLPEASGGIAAVVADLAEVVIPNGSRVGEPGVERVHHHGADDFCGGGVAGGGGRGQPAVCGAGLLHAGAGGANGRG